MPDYDFWKERWETENIGFNLSVPHQSLVRYVHHLKGHRKIFVPLCGKSIDMIFLREQGFEIVGVEFSEIAINDFIAENKLTMSKRSHGSLNIYEGDGFKIYQGDLFSLQESDLAGITCCYDRASMVAFDESERKRYFEFINTKASQIEIILAPLFDYGAIFDAGPPFSVTTQELEELYGKSFKLSVLESTDLPVRENLQKKGALYSKEVTWLLTKK